MLRAYLLVLVVNNQEGLNLYLFVKPIGATVEPGPRRTDRTNRPEAKCAERPGEPRGGLRGASGGELTSANR